MAKNKKKKKGSIFGTLLIILIFIVGLGILLYPTFSNLWNQYRNSRLISDYTQTMAEIQPEDFSKYWEPARKYNEEHRVNVISDGLAKDASAVEDSSENGGAESETETEYPMDPLYKSLLDPMGNGIMGYIEIPKISVKLPIYHGVGSKVLETGCGHIEGTSLPIGGESTHSVLSAHRGLPQAKLFTDMDQMEVGDHFYLQILDEKLAYEIDQIKVVTPEELEDLAIVDGEDYCTLVTCTPYGVNSHRMLVRGKRVPYEEQKVAEEKPAVVEQVQGFGLQEKVLFAGLGAFVLIVILFAIVFRKKR